LDIINKSNLRIHGVEEGIEIQTNHRKHIQLKTMSKNFLYLGKIWTFR
jgi:type IV secretory pathway ATPase VirB11/archaellum biosynthesis ATPase